MSTASDTTDGRSSGPIDRTARTGLPGTSDMYGGPGKPRSRRLYLELAASEVAMFRFLLEAYDNLAYFTVADRRRAVLKIVYAPDARRDLDCALNAIAREVNFRILPDFFAAPERS